MNGAGLVTGTNRVESLRNGLEAAHEQGIIPRDLKPPNIKVRTDGTVKVLDFGRSWNALLIVVVAVAVTPAYAQRAMNAALQAAGAPHLYLEFPDQDHEFWIRRGATRMEKVFLFFSLVSKRTTVLPEK